MSAATERVLVVMAKAPRPGRVKTRLAATLPAAATVECYRALLEDTLALGLALDDTRVAVMAPPEDLDALRPLLPPPVEAVAQQGRGLADALASVFATFTRDRPRRVIAFNSDSPHLPPQLLDAAFDALRSHDIVTGPTDDGGYYLVGATASHEGLFEPAPMGTGGALASLLARAAARQLSHASVAPWFDVDVAGDLARLADVLRRDPAAAPRTARWLAAWLAAADGPARPDVADR